MTINCEESYREALKHAEETGDNTLRDSLDRLKRWATDMNGEIHLSRDRAPLSFCFEMRDKDGNRMMNGGVLYHGDPDESRGFQLTPSKGWQIHT